MRHQLPHLTVFTLALLTAQAHAQSVSPPRDPFEQLQRERLERERERALERSPGGIDAPQPGADKDAVDDGALPEQLPETGPTFIIDRITWQGEALLSAAEFDRLRTPFLGKPLGVRRINLLLDRINRALLNAGYITSRAYVARQQLKEGELVVTVVPGHIEDIRYNGVSVETGRPGQTGVRMALPMAAGDLLQLRDIEQAVDQFNRLRRNQAQVRIRPGEQAGGSIVEIANRQGKAAQTTLTADNLGAADTGKLRLQLGIETGDVLGLMESFAFGLNSSMETNAVYASLALPFGYGTASCMASWSEYQNLIGDTALVYGVSESVSVTYNHLLQRDRHSKIMADIGLTRRRAERSVNNARLTPQVHSALRLGVNRLTRFDNARGAGQWSLDLGWVRGLDWLNADRDIAALPAEAAQAQFDKLEFTANLHLPLGNGQAWRSRLSGQWSATPLFSSEQLFAGGINSVRGFAESAQGGDRGVSLRNEWVKQNLPPPFGLPLRAEPYLFLDGARLQTLADRRWHSLLGAGAGVRLGFAGGQMELIAGWPLIKPHAEFDSGPRFNLSLAYTF